MHSNSSSSVEVKMAGNCPVVNVAGTTVAMRVLSSGTQTVNQTGANPNVTQGEALTSRGNVGTPRLGTAGTMAGAHSGPAARLSTTAIQVSFIYLYKIDLGRKFIGLGGGTVLYF